MNYYEKYRDSLSLGNIFTVLERTVKTPDFSREDSSLEFKFENFSDIVLIVRREKVTLVIECKKRELKNFDFSGDLFDVKFRHSSKGLLFSENFKREIKLQSIENIILEENYFEKIHFNELFIEAMKTVLDTLITSE